MAAVTATVIERFVKYLSTGVDDNVVDPDVFVDLNVPHWRYQLQGVRALTTELRSDAPNGCDIVVERVRHTPGGFALECEMRSDNHVGPGTRYRTLWLAEVVGGRVSEVVAYCTGEWDRATQERHTATAPMLRR